MEIDLQNARQSTDQAKAETKRVESAEGPRVITAEQRKQFIDSVRGLPTGKVLVSAFFENPETHQFGAELLTLLKGGWFFRRGTRAAEFFHDQSPIQRSPDRLPGYQQSTAAFRNRAKSAREYWIRSVEHKHRQCGRWGCRGDPSHSKALIRSD